MLTRRSRKEAPTSPQSPKKKTDVLSKSPSKAKKTTPARGKSKSVERKARTRSRSASKKNTSIPRLILEKVDVSDVKNSDRPKRKKSAESPKFKKSPTPVTEVNDKRQSVSPYANKSNESLKSGRQSRLRSYNDDEDYNGKYKTSGGTQFPKIIFDGVLGNVVLTLFLPAIVILAKIALKAKGDLIPFPRGYLRLGNYYDEQAFLWTAVIVCIQILISFIPLSKKTEGLKDEFVPRFYRFTGFVNLIFGTLIVIGMIYFNCPLNVILDIVSKKTVPHVVASTLIALVVSIIIYIKEQKVGSKSFLSKFLNGNSNNPTVGPLNVKLTLYRYSILLTVLYNSLVILESLKNSINIYLIVLSGMQILYAIDKLLFEFNLLSSFYLQRENVGLLSILQQFLLPAINFLPIQILLSKNIPVNFILLGIVSVVYLFGLILQRYSDYIKYKYKTNTAQARNPAGLKTVITMNGKTIIVGGFWSLIRFPNYLGCILVHLAIILPVFDPTLSSLQMLWPVLLYPLYYIVTLVFRSIKVSEYCQLQYGYAWDHQYATKWNLIPKIF
ncbi:delta(14)-sterol reductase TM7SF2-like [Daktulosphaira vitifoliae]|uniref:delta(14)-sterol reductase TM7SF2-like n=1 Tax=Daktulosphaira vitifoliae TaxID=58002 RepID=UPI0021A9B6AB|nr:delta(14)-sterol reductase TM7SF2-like [Daktulosphaira vitifoliae]